MGLECLSQEGLVLLLGQLDLAFAFVDLKFWSLFGEIRRLKSQNGPSNPADSEFARGKLSFFGYFALFLVCFNQIL
jgi:hypothetical protein